MSLLGLVIVHVLGYVSQPPHVGDYVLVKSSYEHAREKSEKRGPYIL